MPQYQLRLQRIRSTHGNMRLGFIDFAVWEGDTPDDAIKRYADHVRTTPNHKHADYSIIAWRHHPRTGVFPVNPSSVSIIE